MGGRVASIIWRRLLFLLYCSVAAWGQLYTGSVTGVVVDPSGASVPGAEVTLTDVDHDTHTTGNTDEAGRYLFRSLAPGNSSLRVTAANLRPFNVQKIAVDVNATVTVSGYLVPSADAPTSS